MDLRLPLLQGRRLGDVHVQAAGTSAQEDVEEAGEPAPPRRSLLQRCPLSRARRALGRLRRLCEALEALSLLVQHAPLVVVVVPDAPRLRLLGLQRLAAVQRPRQERLQLGLLHVVATKRACHLLEALANLLQLLLQRARRLVLPRQLEQLVPVRRAVAHSGRGQSGSGPPTAGVQNLAQGGAGQRLLPEAAWRRLRELGLLAALATKSIRCR
mmetsp:Transcript_66880/g.209250  ORF Transcript_66880/g.209250 Transcript_66880/m.209250 type:complete len:213 (-) Transcript_66880:241-879(-)